LLSSAIVTPGKPGVCATVAAAAVATAIDRGAAEEEDRLCSAAHKRSVGWRGTLA